MLGTIAVCRYMMLAMELFKLPVLVEKHVLSRRSIDKFLLRLALIFSKTFDDFAQQALYKLYFVARLYIFVSY